MHLCPFCNRRTINLLDDDDDDDDDDVKYHLFKQHANTILTM